MRARPAQEVRDAFAATHARVMAGFDDLDATIERIRAQMVTDGIIRDPRSRTRKSDRVPGGAA